MEDSDTLTLIRALEILPPSPIPEEESSEDEQPHVAKIETKPLHERSSFYDSFPQKVVTNRSPSPSPPLSNNVNYTLDHMRKRSAGSMSTDRGSSQDSSLRSSPIRDEADILFPTIKSIPSLEELNGKCPLSPCNTTTDVPSDANDPISIIYKLDKDRKSSRYCDRAVERPWIPMLESVSKRKTPSASSLATSNSNSNSNINIPVLPSLSPTSSQHQPLISPPPTHEASIMAQQSNSSAKSTTFFSPSSAEWHRQKLLSERLVQRPWMKTTSLPSSSSISTSLFSNGTTQQQQCVSASSLTTASFRPRSSVSSIGSIPSIGESAIVGSRSNSVAEGGVSVKQEPSTLSGEEPDDEVYAAGVTPPISLYSHIPAIFGAEPPQMSEHTCTLVSDRLFIFGGKTSTGYSSKMYIFNCTTNKLACPEVYGDVPPPCKNMSAVLVGKYIYFFGGTDDSKYYNHLFAFNTRTFQFKKLQTQGRKPEPRRGHSAVARGNTICIFGGRRDELVFNDVWKLQIDDESPLQVSFSEVISLDKDTENWPLQRSFHSAHIVNGMMLIYGGCNGKEVYDDLWLFDMDSEKWRPFGETRIEICALEQRFPIRQSDVPYSAGSCLRTLHSSDVIGDYLVVIGGHDGVGAVDYISILNLSTKTWLIRNYTGVQTTGECFHTIKIYDSRCYVVGGRTGSQTMCGLRIIEMTLTSFLVT